MAFAKSDVVNYYNHTLIHYKVMWQLKKSKGLHYGIWYKDTKNLHEAITNSNRLITAEVEGGADSVILDAGCGVGGTSLFIAKELGCKLTGITLSPPQYREALVNATESGLEHLLTFEVNDYTNTGYPDASFDMVFGIESFCHANDKNDVLKEAFRLLKPGGKLVMLDNFKTEKARKPENDVILKTCLKCWAITDIDTGDEIEAKLSENGFADIKRKDMTPFIAKTMRILNRRAYLGILTTWIYAAFYKNKYPFAQYHHHSGWYIYKSYKKGLFDYLLITAKKPE